MNEEVEASDTILISNERPASSSNSICKLGLSIFPVLSIPDILDWNVTGILLYKSGILFFFKTIKFSII